jgi:hypothetical protein
MEICVDLVLIKDTYQGYDFKLQDKRNVNITSPKHGELAIFFICRCRMHKALWTNNDERARVVEMLPLPRKAMDLKTHCITYMRLKLK